MVRPGAMLFTIALGFLLVPSWMGKHPIQWPSHAEALPPAQSPDRVIATPPQPAPSGKHGFLLGGAAQHPLAPALPLLAAQDQGDAVEAAGRAGSYGTLRVRLHYLAEPSPVCLIPPGGGFPFTPSRVMPDEHGSIASMAPNTCLVIGSGMEFGYPDHDFLFQPRAAY